MVKFRINIFDVTLAVLMLISITGLIYYFYELSNLKDTGNHPLAAYISNPGIIKISVASLITKIIFCISFLLLILNKPRYNKGISIIYLLSALIIGFLQWYELYYGSTFYYGEVRDKQGLFFPVLASLMFTLIIWKIDYSQTPMRNFVIKLILTGLINVGLYVLWLQVYEL